MKRGAVVTEYKCVCCETAYTTRKEASACSRYKPKVQPGELIDLNGKPWLVTSVFDGGGQFKVKLPKAYLAAFGYGTSHVKHKIRSLFAENFCNKNPLERYTIEALKRLVSSRAEQLKAANKLLAQVTTEDKKDVPSKPPAKRGRPPKRGRGRPKRVPEESV
jgi:hypothetical protein